MPRSHALDGLRGVAAFIVLVHHALLLVPGLANVYRDPASAIHTHPWLTLAPLHLFWDGRAAVIAFFVLSGLVLAPARFEGGRSWLTYYAGRLPRLYLPVVGSVLLALAWAIVVPRTTGGDHSWWAQIHAGQVGLRGTLDSLVLLFGVSSLNTPLWSLQWEMWFSLLLPLYIWVVLACGRRSWLLLLPALATVAVGQHLHWGSLHYLPVFLVGVVIAHHAGAITHTVARWSRARGVLWMLACIWLAGAAWWPVGAGALGTDWWTVTSEVLVVLGASGIVLYLLGNRRLEVWGTRPGVEWLGSRSFSLYLTHEPLLVSMDYLLPGQRALSIVLGIAAALLLAEVFFRLVERPSHRFSRTMTRIAADRFGR